MKAHVLTALYSTYHMLCHCLLAAPPNACCTLICLTVPVYPRRLPRQTLGRFGLLIGNGNAYRLNVIGHSTPQLTLLTSHGHVSLDILSNIIFSFIPICRPFEALDSVIVALQQNTVTILETLIVILED
jgi:hypothetical protein